MDIKYDAFISYRHSEVDSAVAAEVQKQLERFAVPASITKKTGKKKIERVFRDKEELPITADLNNDIGSALRNSEFLIVICSPRTSQSQWVLKEIETFLKTHDKQHVLTVLAEGDPYEVIPEMLRYEKVVLDNGEIVEREIEPLSCDYRMNFRKAKKEELPRLTAVILGVGYDELVQRARRYKQRRLMAVLSVVFCALLGFIAYMIKTNRQIQANYEQSLINQSEYLSAQSSRALGNKDRFLAIRLALEALPNENMDRPVIPEALYALQQAENIYCAVESTQATETYVTQQLIKKIYVFSEEAKLVALDNLDKLYIWDTTTHKLTYSADIEDLEISDKDVLVKQSLDCISVCDTKTGNELWKINGYFNSLMQLSDNLICFSDSEGTIFIADKFTGSVKDKLTLNNETFKAYYLKQFIADRYIILSISDGNGKNYAGVIDVSEKTYSVSKELFSYLDNFWLYGDKLYTIANLTDDSMDNMILSGREMSTENTITLICYDAKSLQTLWSNKISYYQSETFSDVYIQEDGTVTAIHCNVIENYDENGNFISRCQTRTPVLAAYKNGAGNISLILSDGYFASYSYRSNKVVSQKYFSEGSSVFASSKNGLYLRQNENNIILYNNTYDDSYIEITDSSTDTTKEKFCGEKYLVLVSYNGNIRCVDVENNTFCWDYDCAQIGDKTRLGYHGFSSDETKFYVTYTDYKSNMAYVYIFDCETGNIEIKEYTDDCSYFAAIEDEILYLMPLTDKDDKVVSIHNLVSDDSGFVTSDSHSINKNIIGKYLVQNYSNSLSLINTQTKKEYKTDVETNYDDIFVISEKCNKFIIGADSGVYIYDLELNPVNRIDIESGNISGIYIDESENRVYITAAGKYLYIFNIDGTLVKNIEIEMSRYNKTTISAKTDVIAVCDYNGLYLIDKERLSVKEFIPKCVDFNEKLNKYVLEQNGYVVTYNVLSLEEKIEKGYEILGEYTIPESLKTQYGLN